MKPKRILTTWTKSPVLVSTVDRWTWALFPSSPSAHSKLALRWERECHWLFVFRCGSVIKCHLVLVANPPSPLTAACIVLKWMNESEVRSTWGIFTWRPAGHKVTAQTHGWVPAIPLQLSTEESLMSPSRWNTWPLALRSSSCDRWMTLRPSSLLKRWNWSRRTRTPTSWSRQEHVGV